MISTRSRLQWSRLTPGRWRTFWGTTRRESWTWSRTRTGGRSCSGSSSCSGSASTRWRGTSPRLRRRSSTRRRWRGAWWTTRRCSNPSYSISTPDSLTLEDFKAKWYLSAEAQLLIFFNYWLNDMWNLIILTSLLDPSRISLKAILLCALRCVTCDTCGSVWAVSQSVAVVMSGDQEEALTMWHCDNMIHKIGKWLYVYFYFMDV